MLAQSCKYYICTEPQVTQEASRDGQYAQQRLLLKG